MKKGLLFVISAPSGTGKSTLCRELMKALPELFYSRSATTRQPRSGEKDGLDYHFVTRCAFEDMIRKGEFLEYAEVFGNLYGTPKGPIQKAMGAGKEVLMDVDVQGAMKIRKMKIRKKYLGGVVFIFVLPPSMGILEQRLRQRKTDNTGQITKRIAQAKKEMRFVRYYDYAVVNDNLAHAIGTLKSIVHAERSRITRRRFKS